ncbi:MAG: CHAT domain-containing protein [Chitinophagaceae bacterium]|nr:CHAT domain-containing protein [Chitinophagaceae bacterium]
MKTVPRFIKLCEKTQLQLLFDSAGSTASRLVKSLYRGIEIKSKEARLGIELYKLVWEPLEPFLKGIRKVSYSPAGKLYSIAFNALPIDSNTILMDKYRLQQYTSTRQIALRTTTTIKEKPGSIILFGNALFTMDSLQLVQQRNSRINNAITATSATVAKTGEPAAVFGLICQVQQTKYKKSGSSLSKIKSKQNHLPRHPHQKRILKN